MAIDPSYKTKKVITIGIVSELTGLSERQIRYYEERKLIFPERTEGGNRKYSFADVEQLIEIANKREEGIQTYEIRQEMLKAKEKRKEEERKVRNQMLRGQINARFGIQNRNNSQY
ncbi:MerR family DNA-binding transcriptional regulator [Bacillus methanolicus]|uniref:MerR family transcriptional regulator n=1 Tax=Bacillus methanolicus TaxID=1471 RepID=UPI0023807C5B|nr:MerR family transcriptional regulator [Bacillus methanolicus]MDE3837836.1 MerR family DNA-binding transcriptional regulator [Bacillus methanolicus]